MASVIAANEVGAGLTAQVAVLLSRAYTEDRRVAAYTDDERARWGRHIVRVRAAVPGAGEQMPGDWLARFPTVRNLLRGPEERRRAWHLLVLREDYVAAHVALFEHHFRIDGRRPFRAGFIEDVGTDPLELGRGLASGLMTEATSLARAQGRPLVGLSTLIPGFYRRLGWLEWTGPVSFSLPDGTLAPRPLMVLPTNGLGRRIVARDVERRIDGGPAEG